MIKQKIIIDMDGRDDNFLALSLLITSNQWDPVGISTVCGHASPQKTAEVVLRLLNFFNCTEVPVFQGCSLPLVSTIQKERRSPLYFSSSYSRIHTFAFPPTQQQCEQVPACIWLLDFLRAQEEKITFFMFGPATNLAAVLRIEPEFAKKIKRIIAVGGGYHCSDSSLSAEYNIWADPEAAQIIFQSGIPVTLYPLNSTRKISISPEECDDLSHINPRFSPIFQQMYLTPVKKSINIGAALSVIGTIESDVILDERDGYVEVSLLPGIGDGCTVFDFKYVKRRGLNPNVNVILNADRIRFLQHLRKHLEESMSAVQITD